MSQNAARDAIERGKNAFRAGRSDKAEEYYRSALLAHPHHPDATQLLAALLLKDNRFDEAELLLGTILSKHPHNAVLHLLFGVTLFEQGHFQAAIASFERAIAIKPNYIQAWICRGDSFVAIGEMTDANASLDRAIGFDPRNFELYYKRGSAEMQIHRTQAALLSLDCALQLKPDYFEALVRRGNIRLLQKHLAKAIADYTAAIALQPDSAGVLYNRGTALKELKRLGDGLADYERASLIEPDLPHLEGAKLHAKMQMCDWGGFETASNTMLAKIAQGARAAMPFVILSLPSTPDHQLRCARLYTNAKYPQTGKPLWHGQAYHHEKIRIAYLSGAFVDHPVARSMLGVFENHDRSHFEIMAISYAADDGSTMRRRLITAFDRFIDLSDKDDLYAAELIRRSEIDIAVDLDGFTEVSHPSVLAQRPAPVQVSYLGFPATMGAAFIDYLIADRIVAPNDAAFHEKIAWMPHTFFAAGHAPPIEKPSNRQEYGLPETGIVFCAFNNNYKITPDIFDVWMLLLRKVEGSVLWLRQFNDAVEANLLREALLRDISADRLIFAPTLQSHDDHLKRLRHADIFLDTLYYNAHSTGCDALWCGVPIVTCPGPAFAGRVAASLINAAGFSELIANSLDEYEAIALKLATDPQLLSAIRAKLIANQTSRPLFNLKHLTVQLEQAYESMHRRTVAGLAPDSFYVHSVAQPIA